MKVHKLTVIVIDFDELGADGVKSAIENARYPNRCISPKVQFVETREAGEWHDDHPLNKHETYQTTLTSLFHPS